MNLGQGIAAIAWAALNRGMPKRPAPHTPLYELIEQSLGEDLDRWLSDQRAAGQTWDEITHNLALRTRRRFSREAIRGWYERAHPAPPAKPTRKTQP